MKGFKQLQAKMNEIWEQSPEPRPGGWGARSPQHSGVPNFFCRVNLTSSGISIPLKNGQKFSMFRG